MAEHNGFSRTVFWTLILSCFAFAAGSYAFSWAGTTKSISLTERIAEKISDAIVCNDRLRQAEDNKIKENTDVKFDKIQSSISEIKVMIAKISK